MTKDSVAWNHGFVEANGIRIRHESGTPLVLLHGRPEVWYVCRKNIPVLAERFDVIVPDLRGFGDTEKPELPKVEVPTRSLEGEEDPLVKTEWTDRFSDYFFSAARGAEHFVHYETPGVADREITGFFSKRDG